MLSSTYSGRRVVHLESFEPQTWVDVVRREDVTHAMVVPTMLNRILDVVERRRRRPARRCGPCPTAADRCRRRSSSGPWRCSPSVGFVNAYGLTETSSTLALLGPDDHREAFASDDPAVRARLGSVGRPLPSVEVSIRDADGPAGRRRGARRDLGAGRAGVGRVPRASATALDEGWFHTRDAGHLDDDGYLYVHGRLDDVIVRGGENLSPGEIESVLVDHPTVAAAAVVGIPDDEWGEKVVAAVVLEPGGGGRRGGAARARPRPPALDQDARRASRSATSSPSTRPASSCAACSATSSPTSSADPRPDRQGRPSIASMALELDLAGRRALVTGAGQGVGAAIARTLAAAGAEVAVNDLVADRAEAVVAAIAEDGGRARSAAFDVTDHDQVHDAITGLGSVDVLVNNAGNAGADQIRPTRFVETTPEDWARFLGPNLHGVMSCVHAVLPSMIDGGWGRIVTIVSDAGRTGDSGLAAYGAAKAGAAGFCRGIAHEVARHGVTVNCLSLGTMRTPLSEPFWADDAREADQRALLSSYLVRRPGEPDDAAWMVAALVSPRASWVTGQTIPVNGGHSLAL